MKLSQKTGHKRLAVLIALASLFIVFLILYVTEEISGSVSSKEMWIEFPVFSFVASIVVLILVKVTYWVIDGFQEESQ